LHFHKFLLREKRRKFSPCNSWSGRRGKVKKNAGPGRGGFSVLRTSGKAYVRGLAGKIENWLIRRAREHDLLYQEGGKKEVVSV